MYVDVICQGLNPHSKERSSESPKGFHDFIFALCLHTASKDEISLGLPETPLCSAVGALQEPRCRREERSAQPTLHEQCRTLRAHQCHPLHPGEAVPNVGAAKDLFISFPKHNIALAAENLANPLIHHLNPGH